MEQELLPARALGAGCEQWSEPSLLKSARSSWGCAGEWLLLHPKTELFMVDLLCLCMMWFLGFYEL